jgi:site-specific recombinase XerD
MSIQIDSKTKRAKLEPRREPYWFQLRAGCHIGYRKVSEGDGAWIAKWRDANTGKRNIKSLGAISDDGQRSAFDKARREAEDWFRDLDGGIIAHALTVREICEQHIAALRVDDGDRKADAEEARFTRLVYSDTLGAMELGQLRPDHVAAWRKRLVELPAKVTRSKKGKAVTRQRSGATINRDMVPLRAALNRALDRGLIATDRPWRAELRPIKNADRRREIYLDRSERQTLLAHASDEIRPLLRALALLPLRPGALAGLTVADYSPRLRSLRIGQDKSGGDRRITLPETTAAFLGTMAKGKLPAAPLLAQGDGRAWHKDAWKKPIKAAMLAAGLPPGGTAYSLRHSVITDLVTAGLDLLTVAQLSGTSVAMIEKFYGHLRQERAAQALAGLGL